jgi:5'-nucleotidase
MTMESSLWGSKYWSRLSTRSLTTSGSWRRKLIRARDPLPLPIELRDLGKRRYAVNGTPADCVIVGIRHLLLKTPPNLVLSGVNNGENLADDVTHAGTVAAAIAGTLVGVPSIALSLVTGKEKCKPYWETPKKHGPVILRRLLDLGWPKNVLLNVNFPDCMPEAVKGIAITAQGKRKPEEWSIEPVEDQRGHQLFIARRTSKVRRGCDLWAVQSARISISPLRIDLTDSEAHDQLALDTSLLES